MALRTRPGIISKAVWRRASVSGLQVFPERLLDQHRQLLPQAIGDFLEQSHFHILYHQFLLDQELLLRSAELLECCHLLLHLRHLRKLLVNL